MKKVFSVFVITFCALTSFGQYFEKQQEKEPDPKISIGLGLGQDYGGIGGRLTFLPIKQIATFAGVGYVLIGVGYNFGAQYRFMPDRRVCPFVGAMYGYNAVIKVEGLSELDKIYYGPSLNTGITLRGKRNHNYFSFGLAIPIRSQEYRDDWDKIKQNPNIEVLSEPLPFTISVGYHFALE